MKAGKKDSTCLKPITNDHNEKQYSHHRDRLNEFIESFDEPANASLIHIEKDSRLINEICCKSLNFFDYFL